MNYNHLQYFSVLGHLEHYTKAAEQLGISQPSLSKAISSMENELGIFLFEKQGRNVKLTKYGREYLEYVDQALESVNTGSKLMSRYAAYEKGMIELGFISSAGPMIVAPLIGDFLKNYPQSVFSCEEGTSYELLERLKQEKYDMVFCSGTANDPALLYRSLWEQKITLIVYKGHPLSGHKEVHINKLANYPLIYYKEQASTRELIDSFFLKEQVTPNICCYAGEDFTMAGMVASRIGVALIIDTPLLDLFPIERIPLAELNYQRYIYLVTLKHSYLAGAPLNFINFILQNK